MLLFPLCSAGQGTCAKHLVSKVVCILLDFWAVLRPKEIWGIIRKVPPNLCIRTYVHVKNGTTRSNKYSENEK